jgi:hypothetical protein
MSNQPLVFIVVTLSLLLLVILIVGGVYYNKYRQIYKAIMIATNNPNAHLFLNLLDAPVLGNPASLMIHGVYGAQQFAKRISTSVRLPTEMQTLTYSTDAGFVLAQDTTNPEKMYILFRGTLFDYEWKHDFDYVQTPVTVGARKGNVHKGFQKMYLSYRPYLVTKLAEYAVTEVCVAGHSLGAALSLLAAYDLASALGSDVQVNCFTFAPPKLGDATFVMTFNSLPNIKLTQYLNEADLVPLLPLSVMPNTWSPKKPLFYEHVQPEKFNLFNINNKSWQNNHSLVLHMDVIDGLVTV